MGNLYDGMAENERPVAFLMKTRGIGEKAAQRLILDELRGALSQGDGADSTYTLRASSQPYDIGDMHYRVVQRVKTR